MIDAGLSIEHALSTLNKTPSKDDLTLKKITHSVSKGAALATTFEKHNIIDKFDAGLLRSAELAGRLPQGLTYLAQTQTERQQTTNSLKSLALLPKAILMIGGLAGIFVRIAQFGQTPLQAILNVGVVIFSTLVIIQLLIALLTLDPRVWISYSWNFNFLHKYSKRFQQNFEQLFYSSLSWQFDSGIDAAKALQRNALLLKSTSYQKTVKNAQQQANAGTNLPTLLQKNCLVLSKRMRRVLDVSDNSGTLTKALGHELNFIAQDIQQRTTNLIAWWPRLLYLMVLLIVIKFMF